MTWLFELRISTVSGQAGWRLLRIDEPQIYARLTEIFSDVFDEYTIEVTPGLSAKSVDGWDSLTHIRLISVVNCRLVENRTWEIDTLDDELPRARAPGGALGSTRDTFSRPLPRNCQAGGFFPSDGPQQGGMQAVVIRCRVFQRWLE